MYLQIQEKNALVKNFMYSVLLLNLYCEWIRGGCFE